jgi:hypothetical protein
MINFHCDGAAYIREERSAPNILGPFDAFLVTTPLPAALPLFATGLGGLGLLGWRRKRKASAAIAA